MFVIGRSSTAALSLRTSPLRVLARHHIEHPTRADVLRQARYRDDLDSPNAEPSVLKAAQVCEQAGADSITVHLRADRRHIQDRDVTLLRRNLKIRLNLEMGNTPQNLLASLNANETYRHLFGQAFPQSGSGEIRIDQVYLALAAFESSLVSLNSRYDYYAHGVAEALSPAEIEGLNVFRSFVARCAECHTPPLFSNQQIAVLGTPEPEGLPLDKGRELVTGDASQRAGFKVPSLRNVALTGPWMHSGRYDELREAVAFYTGGRGHAVPEGEQLSLHWHIWEPKLTDTELDRLVDALVC